MNQKNGSNILSLTMGAMAVALIAVCSWISIPMFGVPATLQVFAIWIVAGLFDLKTSVSAMMVYILLGAVGVPVFANFKSGFGVLLGPTGGYLIGFFIAIFIISLFRNIKKDSIVFLFIGMILGIVESYAFGTVWFYFVAADGTRSIWEILGICVFPFVIPDLTKIILAAVLSDRLSIPLRRMGYISNSKAQKI